MRIPELRVRAMLVAGLVGCSKTSGPVVVTPEMEAEQKLAEQQVP